MTSGGFEDRSLDPDERVLLNIAVESLEVVCEATLVAIVFVDKRGTFLHMRTGQEHLVARLLETVNWRHARMITEEHIEE